jgi:hypothetical protein
VSQRSHVVLPIPELVVLLEATLLFVIQLLIARHPDLLDAPEEADRHPPPPLYGARRILAAVRELNHALDSYRVILHDLPGSTTGKDDIPF